VPVAAGVDESDLGVDAFDEGVGDTEFDGGDDRVEVDLQAFGQGDEGVDAAAFSSGDPAPQVLTGAAGWVVDAVEVAQLLFESPGPAGLPPESWRLPLCGPRLDGRDLFVFDGWQQAGRTVSAP
jgi:hypothetical protein